MSTDMTIFSWLISACWAILVGYWLFSGFAAVGSRWVWWREITLRLGFFASVVLILQVEAAANVLQTIGIYLLNTSPLAGLAGFLLSAVGVAMAIGARVSLGAGWVASGAEKRELITTGPYAFVRHPLYGGLLLVMVGSALGQSVLWLLPLVVYGPRFFTSARYEEQLLIEQFSDQYRDYRRRTRMLVPLVF
jgi:protein-S-isoprenylcysteine O-methyltransferase Ste14